MNASLSPSFEPLIGAFDANFSQRGEIGASVSLWLRGQEIFSLHRGTADVKTGLPWQHDTLIPIYSATKPASAACVLLALYRRGMTPDVEIGELWKNFPSPFLTVGEVLSHQGGLAAFVRPADIFDLEDCVAAAEKSRSAWLPPMHGYHPHTYGPILDWLMVCLCGERIGTFWEREVRAPLGLDFYIGLPESEFYRVGTLYPGKVNPSQLHTPFYEQYFRKGTPIYRAFNSITGLGSVHLMNTPRARTSASPASGGLATAHGLAQFYQTLLGYCGGRNVFPEEVLAWLSSRRVQGNDLTLLEQTAFSCGAMCDPTLPDGSPLRTLYGRHGFGHTGAGGAHGFAESATGLSFAYTMNAMEFSVLPGVKTSSLVSAALSC